MSDVIADKARARYGKQSCVIPPSALADYLRLAIKAKGISYRDLARRSGERISASTVSDILKGKNRNPTIDIIRALAKGLDEPEVKVFAAACGINEPIEPEGFKESDFWRLFEAYNQISDPIHRKMTDGGIRVLIHIIEAFPSNEADGSERAEAVRKFR